MQVNWRIIYFGSSCESKDIYLVEEQINKIIDEISSRKPSTLDEIKKAINIVKSNMYLI